VIQIKNELLNNYCHMQQLTSNINISKNVIPSLNGLRAISILLVLFSHVQLHNLHWEEVHGGQIGVNIFFIISGFLITTLLLKEESKTGDVSLKKFYIRRVLRILPVYYLLLFVYFIMHLQGVLNFNRITWISSLTYTRYFFNDVNWEAQHLWSLNIEEHFYLIWPIVFVFMKNHRKQFAILMIIAVTITRLVTNVSDWHLFTRSDSLLVGCLFALYYKKIEAFVEKAPSYIIVLPFVLGIVCGLGGARIIPVHDVEIRNHLAKAFVGSFGTITNICVGFIIVISIKRQNNLFFKLLNTRQFNYVGVLFYSIYIWQQLFFSDNIGLLSSFPINLILIFIVSVISYELYEKHFLQLKERFTSDHKAPKNVIQTPMPSAA